MVVSHHTQTQRGIALITAMLILLLLLSLSLGFALLVSSEQRSSGVDLDHSQAFYAAYGAMEEMNAQLAYVFSNTYAPQASDLNPIVKAPPTFAGVNFYDPNNVPTNNGYELYYLTDKNGNPAATNGQITQGQYAGFQGQITNYTIIVNAQTQNYSLTTGNAGAGIINQYGSEVRLVRTLQTVSIPVFQFGIFSETDLSFFPGPPFSFGGVVATNGDLYLAAGNGGTLTLSSQTSAYGDIITDQLSNGLNNTTSPTFVSNYAGTVQVTNSAGGGTYTTLVTGPGAGNMGSITGGPSLDETANPLVCPVGPGSKGTPNATWTSISISTYKAQLRDGAFGCSRGTGAKYLELPLVVSGASGIDLIKLPPPNEDTKNCAVFVQRYFTYTLDTDCKTPIVSNYAMLRIIIADTAGEITTLPGISAGAPVAMTPNKLVNNGTAGGAKGDVKVPIPWAMSQGSTNNGCTQGNLSTNCGDWFAAGWSRLGMGDGTTTICSPAPTAPATCGPYIKIEYQDSGTAGWVDKTLEILELGTTGRNISNGAVDTVGSTPTQLAAGAGASCYEPQPDAVIRLQRVRDVPSNTSTYTCGYSPVGPFTKGVVGGGPASGKITTNASDYIPLALFDPREGLLRDVSPGGANVPLGGVMHYVELDVTNLARWFTGAIGTKGAAAASTVGYLVYFSDRRGNQPCTPVANCPSSASASGSRKLGNLGWSDFVNPKSASGTPNGTLDVGEDLQGANLSSPGKLVTMPLDTYGGVTGFIVSSTTPYAPAAGIATADLVYKSGGGALTGSGNAISLSSSGGNCTSALKCGDTSAQTGVNMETLVSRNEARVNPPLFFRRALKLTDGAKVNASLGACGANPCGLTITSENPVYVEGNYNATGGACAGSPLVCTYLPNAAGTETPSAVLSDALTLLSNSWNDINSFNSPFAYGGRAATTTYYRLAVLAGKGVSFPLPTAGSPPKDFGTDGGVHNFLRFLEDWGAGGGQNIAYNGSIVSFYFNEQAVGTYKCCTTVYNPPGRGYAFDNNFLTPALLPPRTPAFRDINTLGFTQLILPNQLY